MARVCVAWYCLSATGCEVPGLRAVQERQRKSQPATCLVCLSISPQVPSCCFEGALVHTASVGSLIVHPQKAGFVLLLYAGSTRWLWCWWQGHAGLRAWRAVCNACGRYILAFLRKLSSYSVSTGCFRQSDRYFGAPWCRFCGRVSPSCRTASRVAKTLACLVLLLRRCVAVCWIDQPSFSACIVTQVWVR